MTVTFRDRLDARQNLYVKRSLLLAKGLWNSRALVRKSGGKRQPPNLYCV